MSKLGDKVIRVVCDLKLVWVGVGVVRGEKGVNLSASEFVVLSRVEILLACGDGLLCSGLRRGSSCLGLLVLVLLSLLLATLEFGLGDLVDMSVEVLLRARDAFTFSPVTGSRWRFSSCSAGGAVVLSAMMAMPDE